MPERACRLLFQLPSDCRVYTKISPPNQWGWREHLLNRANYLLEILAWQNATPSKKGEQAKHKREKPKLFVPPFMKGDAGKDTESHTVEDIKAILAQPRG